MTKERAIEILSQVGAVYKGNLEEHQLIQSALEFIKTLEVPPTPEDTKKIKESKTTEKK